MLKVVFVCTGNTCRSPMAQYVFQNLAKNAGLQTAFEIESAGTNVDLLFSEINKRAVTVLENNNIPCNPHREAKEIAEITLEDLDYIVAIDQRNFAKLQQQPNVRDTQISLLLSYVNSGDLQSLDVPDPIYDDQYEHAFELIQRGCIAFFDWLKEQHSLV